MKLCDECSCNVVYCPSVEVQPSFIGLHSTFKDPGLVLPLD